MCVHNGGPVSLVFPAIMEICSEPGSQAGQEVQVKMDSLTCLCDCYVEVWRPVVMLSTDFTAEEL